MTERNETGRPVFYLKDYRPTPYTIAQTELEFDLEPQDTRVTARLHIARREGAKAGAKLALDGDSLTLREIKLNGEVLGNNAYRAAPDRLEIFSPPAEPFTLELTTRLNPEANRALMGLYRSNGVFCTQCEADGFRRITYYYDRPDVLSVYTVRLIADKKTCPVLLSNGNRREAGALPNGRHYALWHDPHPKPCYLFACVGGDLERLQDSFRAQDGRNVELNIYTEQGKAKSALYAMDSLKRAFKWDEEKFGRVYDLDIFNVVAVSDFNMGAMENKGLNIFNDKCVLAEPQTATDEDYANVERVIAHEYFHNWTGNRITCRDWFQLCLKEGLTVFRDQEFSSDMRSRPVKRLEDVNFLISCQFAEDAGPLRHPVRPRAYAEINNFYTVTVYEKGAELVRMIQTLLGQAGFKKGMDLYFARHDGQACAIEDFIQCFADSSGRDFGQFMLWYNQAGTPRVQAETDYDETSGALTVRLTQSLENGQPDNQPMLIPLRFGLIGADGADLPYQTADKAVDGDILLLTKAAQSFTLRLKAGTKRPVLSLLRGFSAPVAAEQRQSLEEKLFLAAHDADAVSRYRALRELSLSLAAQMAKTAAETAKPQMQALIAVLVQTAADERLEPAFRAECLTFPSEAEIAAEWGENVSPDAVYAARQTLLRALAAAGLSAFAAAERRLRASGAFSPDAAAAGRRALRRRLIHYLCLAQNSPAAAAELYAEAGNMSERLAGLSILCREFAQAGETAAALKDFERRFADNGLVMDKYFSLRASAPGAETLAAVEALCKHPRFSYDNPNRVRALIGAYAANQTGFHRADGAGYRFFADSALRLDSKNPQLAARLLTALSRWRLAESGRRQKLEAELRRLSAAKLSRDSRDIITRLLA